MKEKIKKIIENLLENLDFLDFEIEIKELIDEPMTFNIKSDDGSLLIGEQGISLISLEHIAKIVFHKENPENETINPSIAKGVNFIIDVNGYRAEKARAIKQLAKELCQRVILTKKPVTLPPMNAYERRIIHMELAAHPSVITESQGEGRERRLIIKPYP